MELLEKFDFLLLREDKSILKQLQPKQIIYYSSNIYKFNDYKKKQERNIMITNLAVYNLRNNTVRRKIQIRKIKAITVSHIGTEFVIHIPQEYDYRYASSDKRDKIIYFIIKAYYALTKCRMPVYTRQQLNLVNIAMTKQDKKKKGNKELTGDFQNFNDQQYKKFVQGEEIERENVRRSTKTLYSRDSDEQVSLSDFIIRIVLGRGAFGTVYLVQKKNTKDLFAMKSINKQDIVKKGQIQHTKTQKMILSHINHPYLVNLVYAFQTPTKIYFIMQFMKGGQLYQHLASSKRFSQKRAKFYIMQIALGLGYLHSEGIVYRDIKLENILMDENGNVCLTDFGMAKILKEGQLTFTFCGTPQYLAPQIINGQGYDKSADWWSLGILAYEMIYGLPPFYDKQTHRMFKRIKQDQLVFNQKIEVSKQAKDFMSKILNRDADLRLGSNNDVKQVLGHDWFKDLSIEKMMKKQISPPFKPKIQGDDYLQNFDKQFTSEKIKVELNLKQQVSPKQSWKFNEIFRDF